jgi:hypothetical protein
MNEVGYIKEIAQLRKSLEAITRKSIAQQTELKAFRLREKEVNAQKFISALRKIDEQKEEIGRLRKQVSEERKRGIVERRDIVRLRWLFDKDNLNAHVSLPKECWAGTKSYRLAIDNARRMKK